MRLTTLVRGLAAFAVLTAGGCKSLDIQNPNEPDRARAFADPAAMEAVTGGSLRAWINAWNDMDGGGPLVVQARTYSASWNNFNMNFYAQVDNPTDPPASWHRNTRSWQNSPSAAGRTTIEAYWEQCYSALSLANDVLGAIRNNGLIIFTDADTRKAEAVALLVQGLATSCIAINYDKGYIIDENTDLGALVYSNRAELRDAAMASFDAAVAMANANTFTTPTQWSNGTGYTNSQIARIANTMAAFTLANWPRDAAENVAVDWAQVVAYASNGISSGTPFNFGFTGDGCLAWCPEILTWFNSLDTGRIHTRLAAMLDPGTQTDPWPLAGNPQPNSADDRLGDGSFGTAGMQAAFGSVAATANAGTDFAWSSQAIFNMSRGFYQQSNIGHIRYDLSGVQSPTGIYGAVGPAPVVNASMNDLLWAEGLIRTNTNLPLAATLINNTRVTRGGLSAAAGGDGVPTLLTRLNYELEVELLGQGAAAYYLQRRLGTLLPGTPHEMPVPAKELGVFSQPLYTWGGTGAANSPTPP